MTVPLCLLCLDFLLCEQQKTQKTTEPPAFCAPVLWRILWNDAIYGVQAGFVGL